MSDRSAFLASLTPDQRIIHDALCTSHYYAGIKAGWNAGCIRDDDKAQAEYHRLMEANTGHLQGYREAKQRLDLLALSKDTDEDGAPRT